MPKQLMITINIFREEDGISSEIRTEDVDGVAYDELIGTKEIVTEHLEKIIKQYE